MSSSYAKYATEHMKDQTVKIVCVDGSSLTGILRIFREADVLFLESGATTHLVNPANVKWLEFPTTPLSPGKAMPKQDAVLV